eukprot:gene31269-6413_t
MIADEQRGFAWTRALLGLPANEIHVCGDGSALQLVRRLCGVTKEKLEVEPQSLSQTLLERRKEWRKAVAKHGKPGSGLPPPQSHATTWGRQQDQPSTANRWQQSTSERSNTEPAPGLSVGGQGQGAPSEAVRLHPNGIGPNPTNQWECIQAGDCIVAFAKLDLLGIKASIEASTKHKVCIIYGALPPETRCTQANLFNDSDSGYDVLVASDAIGMGLNLNIRRIIFTTLEKTFRETSRPIPYASVRQIAGRAGRRNSIYPTGYVTATDYDDLVQLSGATSAPLGLLSGAISAPLDKLSGAISAPLEPAERAGLAPEPEHVELLAATMPGATLLQVLQQYGNYSQLDGMYFFGNMEAFIAVAELLEEVPEMTITDKVRFCAAPVNLKGYNAKAVREWLLLFAANYVAGAPVHAPRVDLERIQKMEPFTRLGHLESCYRTLMLWVWLANRFKKESRADNQVQDAMAAVEGDKLGIMDHPQFPGRVGAVAMAAQIIQALDATMFGLYGMKPPSSKHSHKGRTINKQGRK